MMLEVTGMMLCQGPRAALLAGSVLSHAHRHDQKTASGKHPRPPLGALKALTSADGDPSRSWPWSPFVVQKTDTSQRLFKDVKVSFLVLGQALTHLERMISLYTAPVQVGTLHCLFLCTPAASVRPGTAHGNCSASACCIWGHAAALHPGQLPSRW